MKRLLIVVDYQNDFVDGALGFEGAELRVDLDKVPALAEDRMALWREVSAADWLTADEKKALLAVG